MKNINFFYFLAVISGLLNAMQVTIQTTPLSEYFECPQYAHDLHVILDAKTFYLLMFQVGYKVNSCDQNAAKSFHKLLEKLKKNEILIEEDSQTPLAFVTYKDLCKRIFPYIDAALPKKILDKHSLYTKDVKAPIVLHGAVTQLASLENILIPQKVITLNDFSAAKEISGGISLQEAKKNFWLAWKDTEIQKIT